MENWKLHLVTSIWCLLGAHATDQMWKDETMLTSNIKEHRHTAAFICNYGLAPCHVYELPCFATSLLVWPVQYFLRWHWSLDLFAESACLDCWLGGRWSPSLSPLWPSSIRAIPIWKLMFGSNANVDGLSQAVSRQRFKFGLVLMAKLDSVGVAWNCL